MKEIVVISGKGGTGKTSITAALASFFKEDCVVADCDVDAADLHILLQPTTLLEEDFYSGEGASIQPELCGNCGICATHCHFDAIVFQNGRYVIDAISCEGCGYCSCVCTRKAIRMYPKKAGVWMQSRSKYHSMMIHARLGIGAENSGKLVAKVKKEAKQKGLQEGKSWMVVDGSPGIGCPVVSSLSGAHFVLLVTEPTPSGLHDLQRVYEVVKRFGLRAGCIINKADLNVHLTSCIESFMAQENILHVSSLPYTTAFTKAMIAGKTILEYHDESLAHCVREGFEKIVLHLKEQA